MGSLRSRCPDRRLGNWGALDLLKRTIQGGCGEFLPPETAQTLERQVADGVGTYSLSAGWESFPSTYNLITEEGSAADYPVVERTSIANRVRDFLVVTIDSLPCCGRFY